jgi:hypothetical protein
LEVVMKEEHKLIIVGIAVAASTFFSAMLYCRMKTGSGWQTGCSP